MRYAFIILLAVVLGSCSSRSLVASSSVVRPSANADPAGTDFGVGSQQWDVGGVVFDVFRGPDNRIWFNPGPGIEAISDDGTITQYPVPAYAPAIAGRRTMWFIDGSSAGMMTTVGHVIFQYPLAPGSCPGGVAAGPDGNAWITDSCNGAIERLTPSGQVTSYSIPSRYSLPMGITAGSDGNLWFAESLGNVGRITTAGVITEFPFKNTEGGLGWPTLAPDGNIYVPVGPTDLWAVTPQGIITDYDDPAQKAYAQHVTVGPDGKSLWLAISSGYVEKFSLATHTFGPDIKVVNGGVYGIVAGPDHDLWYGGFRLNGGDEIGIVGVRN